MLHKDHRLVFNFVSYQLNFMILKCVYNTSEKIEYDKT